MMALVLSIFPGIGLFDRAFEEQGFCIVRGPDLLWGGDIKRFHPPAGRFDGVIGGPPCQAFSQLNQAGRAGKQRLAEDLIPEFARVVAEAAPAWFVMENVPQAPTAMVSLYESVSVLANNRWFGGVQNRIRRFTFGTRLWFGAREMAAALQREEVALETAERAGCFTANGTQWDAAKGRSRSQRTRDELRKGIRLQGLPDDFDLPGMTIEGAIRAVGNGVPIPLGRAVARAVKCFDEARRVA